jgi:hypothetical protein
MILEVYSWGEPVGSGRTSAVYCTLQGIAKRGDPEDGYCVANEYICARLAYVAGLPVPPHAVVRNDEGELCFVSLRVGPGGESPPPVIVAHLIADHPRLVAEIVAFDVLISNPDRHAANLAYSRVGTISPAIFDHDQSLFGVFAGRGAIHLRQRKDQTLAHHVLADGVCDEAYARAACQRFQAIPHAAIEGICQEVQGLGLISPEEVQAVTEFLVDRIDNLDRLVSPLLKNLAQGALA